jgi:signal transduction histidine kinase
MLFSEPPMPSADAEFDPSQIPLLSRRAGELLAARGVFGLVWLGNDLKVLASLGTLVDFIATGQHVSRSLPPVIGLESDIQALKGGQTLRVPSVTIVAPAGPGPHLNLVFHPLEADYLILLVVSHAEVDTKLAVELSRQMRGRLMAEAEVAAKSQALARTNAELKIANSNLEQFATIATHDLKAPMRALGYLADEIEKAIAAGDTETARQRLAELRGQAGRVSSMLSALLHYSSAGRTDAAIESVDVPALIDEIVRSLPRGTVEVKLEGKWPRIETLAAPLALALRNLIDNVIKHHDRSVPMPERTSKLRSPTTAPASRPSITRACSCPSARSAAAARASGLRSCKRCSTPSADRSCSNPIRPKSAERRSSSAGRRTLRIDDRPRTFAPFPTQGLLCFPGLDDNLGTESTVRAFYEVAHENTRKGLGGAYGGRLHNLRRWPSCQEEPAARSAGQARRRE